jgi:Photosynthetic reaction centre cytochrome C subunit
MRLASVLLLFATLACETAPRTQPAAAAAHMQPTPAAAAQRAALANPNQELNDRLAKQIADRIAGHEKEPAEKVFMNVQVMKTVPAERLLRIMNGGYSRALGVACTHCHVEQDFSSDDKRPKRAAREMMDMNRMINERLRSLQNLEGKAEEHFVSCSTCHRGHTDPNEGLH